jgi:hypothetical protein
MGRYVDFLRFTASNTLMYHAVLGFIGLGEEKKLMFIRPVKKRMEVLQQVLMDRIQQNEEENQ